MQYVEEYIYIALFLVVLFIVNFTHNRPSRLLNYSSNQSHSCSQRFEIRKECRIKIKTRSTTSSENLKPTIIIAFSDINYWPAAKIWFHRMISLGYQQVRMYALDQIVYQKMLTDIGPDFTFSPKQESKNIKLLKIGPNYVYKTEYDPKFKEKYYYSVGSFKNRAKVWNIRVQTITSLLEQGYSVLSSDIDSLWLKYVNLDIFFGKRKFNFDIVHSIAGFKPREVVDEWGFSVCGCLGFYRATRETLKWFDIYKSRCHAKCDDQDEINFMYRDLKIRWIKNHECLFENQEETSNFDYIGIFEEPNSGVYQKRFSNRHLKTEVLNISTIQVGVISSKIWQRNGTISDCNKSKNSEIPWCRVLPTRCKHQSGIFKMHRDRWDIMLFSRIVVLFFKPKSNPYIELSGIFTQLTMLTQQMNFAPIYHHRSGILWQNRDGGDTPLPPYTARVKLYMVINPESGNLGFQKVKMFKDWEECSV